MSESRLRIPEWALATLVLGGGSCGDDSGGGGLGGSAGTDVSASRIKQVAKGVCSWEVRCADEEAAQEDACVAESVSYLTEISGTDEICADAMLDYYGCYASLACDVTDDEFDAKCGALADAFEQACAELTGDE